MDALQLLREVSSAYDAIETLSLEAEIVAESGDEFSNSISRHRLRFHYARPNRMRCEPLGRNGILVIANGAEVQFRFEPQGQISTHPLHQLPHSFQPDRPLTGNDEPFLFTSIHQQVDSAEYLRDENGCHVVSVRYWVPTWPMLDANGPVEFWIRSSDRVVMRQSANLGHRMPTDDEYTWTHYSVNLRDVTVNSPIPDDTFRLMPAQKHHGGMMSVGGGGGFAESRPDGSAMEHRGSHEWDGDTLVEHSRWKLRGRDITLHRRFTFSAGDTVVDIHEQTEAPGAAPCESSLRLEFPPKGD